MTSQAVRICISVISCRGDLQDDSQNGDVIVAPLAFQGKGLEQVSSIGGSSEIILLCTSFRICWVRKYTNSN